MGTRQDLVIAIAKKKGYISIGEVRTIYPKRAEAMSFMVSLEVKRLLKKELATQGYQWRYVGRK